MFTFTFERVYDAEKLKKTIQYAQKWLDNEVLKRSEPYTPLLTGALRNSSSLNTTIGSGLIVWRTPYARRRYYETKIGSPRGAKRGGYWFARMKKDNIKVLHDGVFKILHDGIK